MKRMAWSLVVAGLMASQVQANDPAGGAKPAIDPVPVEVAVDKIDPALIDPAPLEVQTMVVDGVPTDDHIRTLTGATDDSLMATTGIADGNVEVYTFGGIQHEPGENLRGNDQELMMNTMALGLPGLGDNRINLNAFGLFGEHRDSMRLAREGQTVTTRKVGLLHLFGKNKSKSEATVRTVSTTERARAQKMAEIDKLRDEALKTGDRAKLAQADKLEAQLNAAPAKATSKLNPFRK